MLTKRDGKGTSSLVPSGKYFERKQALAVSSEADPQRLEAARRDKSIGTSGTRALTVRVKLRHFALE
jgi:hypothetical protein